MNFRCPIKPEFTDVALASGSLGREDTQGQWQRAVAGYLNNCTLLDVGAGLGESKQRMAIRNISVTTQDIFPGAQVDLRAPLRDIIDTGERWDAVTAFDVIEHVRDQEEFVLQMRELARRWVVLSTPNYLLSHNTHIYHVREWCPDEVIPFAAELGLQFEIGWCQLPGRGVFPVEAASFPGVLDTHGFCALLRKV